MASTPPAGWRKQATTNRQGSEGVFDESEGVEFTADEASFHQQARELYRKRLARGVAREQARKDLPLSTYTEAYWKIDLHNLLHFLELRMDDRAQLEIRQYAETMGRQIVGPLVPLVWEAFVDYRLGAMTLSRLDQEVIARLVAAGKTPAGEAEFLAAGDPSWAGLQRSRERDECREKLVRLGILES
jgi:thymidylate synthase (FAD)